MVIELQLAQLPPTDTGRQELEATLTRRRAVRAKLLGVENEMYPHTYVAPHLFRQRRHVLLGLPDWIAGLPVCALLAPGIMPRSSARTPAFPRVAAAGEAQSTVWCVRHSDVRAADEQEEAWRRARWTRSRAGRACKLLAGLFGVL